MKYYLFLVCVFFCCSVMSCHKSSTHELPIPKVYHQDGEVKQLLYNDPKGVNLVILGDAFIKDDLDTGGYYDTKVKQLVSYLFSVDPYKQYKQHFNVYVVYAQSQKRGASQGQNPTDTLTKFGAFFDTKITRVLEINNSQACINYVQKAVPWDKAHIIIALVNDDTYGGSGGRLAVFSTNILSKYLMVHELGHSFGGLADEYIDPVEAALSTRTDAQYYPNVDTTNDPLKIKWAQFLDQSAYQNIVGAYEGGYYRATGVYRPEYSSVMLDLNHANYNAPSREAIVQHIDQILNIPFDFNAFLKADSGSIQPITVGIGRVSPPKNDFINRKERILQIQQSRKQ